VLFDLANEVNKTKSVEAASLLKYLAGVLGLLSRDSDEFLQAKSGAASNAVASDVEAAALNVDDLITKRLEAKQAKNFAEADRIRKELAEAGIILEDTPQGTTWRNA